MLASDMAESRCLVVALGQSDLVVHIFVCISIFFFDSFSIIVWYKTLNIVSCAVPINPCCVPILYLVVCIC